jgi:hypothetical protein
MKILILKVFDDLKEDSNKQMNEVKKLVQSLVKKFNKEIEILKNKNKTINHTRMKNSNQI